MSSLYSQYLKEIAGKEVVETPSGFATYLITDKDCYIQDIYVIPEQRQSKVASEFADQIAEIAKERGCNRLLGSVIPSANGSTRSLKVLLGYGFQLDSCTNNFIVMSKEI